MEERIERLVAALSESSAVSASYISTQIETLHKQRERLMSDLEKRRGPGHKYHLDFETASFEEKRLIAREFLEKIRLKDDEADVIWKL